MSSKCKILSIALVALLAFGFYSATTKADVTGSFGLNILYMPIDCESVAVRDKVRDVVVPLADQPCEKTLVKFDFEASININITVSGLTIGLHSHLGTTGIEDVILSLSTTLGALDIRDQFVFAQPFGLIKDGTGMANYACYENAPGSSVCDLFFIKKRVEISIALGGVTFSNLAVLEDVNFPECTILVVPAFGFAPCVGKPQSGIYTPQSQAFGFGDRITISGQTPSGISVTSYAGICLTEDYNLIKKHIFLGVVNPHCAAGAQTPSPKPPLFFDFEYITVEGVPLTDDVLLDLFIFCDQFTFPAFSCDGVVNVTFTGAVVFNPIILQLYFDSASQAFFFNGLALILQAGTTTITIVITPALTISRIDASLRATINPDTNPGTLSVALRLIPGVGLNRLDIGLSVVREGLQFSTTARFSGNPVVLSRVTFRVTAAAGGIVTLTTSATYSFNPAMLSGQIGATVNF